MYTKTALISAIAGLAAAAPLTPRSDSGVFEAVSIRSGSDLQYAAINANGYKFYVGKSASTYCPTGVENLDCSNYNTTNTIFAAGSTGGLSLQVSVPGGQQVYVDSDGSLGYTTAHSASIPTNASTTPFSYTAAAAGSVGDLTFNGSGFTACPTGEIGIYQIFANAVSADTQTNCTGIAFATSAVDSNATTAWQY